MVLRYKSQNDKTNKSEKNDNLEKKLNLNELVVNYPIFIEKQKKIKRRPSFKCMFDNKYWCSLCEQHDKQCDECIKDTEYFNKNKLAD